MSTAEFERVQAVLRGAAQVEEEWRQKVPQTDDERVLYTPWMPFPLPAFTAMLAEAVPVSPGPRFLDIGCGPGSKMMIAQEIFALDAHGIERVPEYVNAAWQLGFNAEVADALGWKGYGNADLIWFHRPFRDPVKQAELEKQVWADMAPGAVVMCANLEDAPWGWPCVLDDWEARRGIWLKPPLP